jgi:hypothetical protein
MEDLFAHAWARLDRAGQISPRMAEIWNSYIEQHPYDFGLLGEGEGVYVLRVYEDAAPPQELAVATGEWINHLRSALDYAIWATAAHVSGCVPPPNQGQIQYPIYDSREAWERGLPRLRSLASHHRQMLLTMQPFNSDSDANYLGWVNRIARSDRHRHLSRMTAYISELDPALGLPAGYEATMQLGERVIADGYADVVRFVVTPCHADVKVEVNPRIGIDPDIEEWTASPFWRRIRFPDRLRMLELFVGGEIAAYEYDCTGGGRKSDMLTQTYKDECDARHRAGRRWPARQRTEVQWSKPLPKRRGTPSELAGEGFPEHGSGVVGRRQRGGK